MLNCDSYSRTRWMQHFRSWSAETMCLFTSLNPLIHELIIFLLKQIYCADSSLVSAHFNQILANRQNLFAASIILLNAHSSLIWIFWMLLFSRESIDSYQTRIGLRVDLSSTRKIPEPDLSKLLSPASFRTSLKRKNESLVGQRQWLVVEVVVRWFSTFSSHS